MTEQASNGFSFRVRLGDILTMMLLIVSTAGILLTVMVGCMTLSERIAKMEVRLDAIEKKLDKDK